MPWTTPIGKNATAAIRPTNHRNSSGDPEQDNRVTTPEVECTAGDDPAGTRHATHLCGNLIDIGYHIDREGRDAGVKGGGGVAEVASITVFVCDIGMESTETRAV
jgi:hypothetical protein